MLQKSKKILPALNISNGVIKSIKGAQISWKISVSMWCRRTNAKRAEYNRLAVKIIICDIGTWTLLRAVQTTLCNWNRFTHKSRIRVTNARYKRLWIWRIFEKNERIWYRKNMKEYDGSYHLKVPIFKVYVKDRTDYNNSCEWQTRERSRNSQKIRV